MPLKILTTLDITTMTQLSLKEKSIALVNSKFNYCYVYSYLVLKGNMRKNTSNNILLIY